MPDTATVTPQEVWSARLLRLMDEQDGKQTPAAIVELAEMDPYKVGRHLQSVPDPVDVTEPDDAAEPTLPEVPEIGPWREDTTPTAEAPDEDADGPLTAEEASTLARLYKRFIEAELRRQQTEAASSIEALTQEVVSYEPADDPATTAASPLPQRPNWPSVGRKSWEGPDITVTTGGAAAGKSRYGPLHNPLLGLNYLPGLLTYNHGYLPGGWLADVVWGCSHLAGRYDAVLEAEKLAELPEEVLEEALKLKKRTEKEDTREEARPRRR